MTQEELEFELNYIKEQLDDLMWEVERLRKLYEQDKTPTK